MNMNVLAKSLPLNYPKKGKGISLNLSQLKYKSTNVPYVTQYFNKFRWWGNKSGVAVKIIGGNLPEVITQYK